MIPMLLRKKVTTLPIISAQLRFFECKSNTFENQKLFFSPNIWQAFVESLSLWIFDFHVIYLKKFLIRKSLPETFFFYLKTIRY